MATRYVDSSAGGANDGTSWTDAWTDGDSAMNAIAGLGAGPHLILVKGGLSYLTTWTIDTVGAPAGNVVFRGDDGSGTATTFTIDAQSVRANGIATTLGGAIDTFYVFENMIVTGCTSHGVAGDLDYLTFKRCKLHTNGGNGADVGNHSQFEDCDVYSNTADGINATGNVVVIGSRIYGNGSEGVIAASGVVLCNVFYNNTADSLKFTAGTELYVWGNTFDGDSKAGVKGINFSNIFLQQALCINNTVYNFDGAGSVGISAGRDIHELAVSLNNHLNSNTANYSNFATFSGEQTGAPLFVDEANRDYTPAANSPAVAAGFDAGA